jgi:hypothetical protein
MRALFLVLSLTLLLAGQATALEKKEAFLVDKRDFKKQYQVIALAPVDAEPVLKMPDSVAAVLEEVVTARLQKRGYTVIPSSVLADIRKTMEEQVGGFKDPDTGREDLAKMQSVRTHAFRELWFQHKFDALANIRISINQVPMESDRVEWDGAKQKIEYEGRGKKYAATVAVSSVSVAIYDSTNKPLYVFYGGLEPLMYRSGEQLEVLPAEKFFLDEEKIRDAAEMAVDPF